jgi:hypothetical protein
LLSCWLLSTFSPRMQKCDSKNVELKTVGIFSAKLDAGLK